MKAPLRKLLRKRRRALTAAEHRTLSRRAARTVMRLPAFAAGKRIAVYLPFDRETDTRELISAARRRGVRLYVPVISNVAHGRMRFHPLVGITKRGTFGIRVPKCAAHPISPRWLNLIVLPLVGAGTDGRRLGMGGGFYDRALSFRKTRRLWRGPHLTGLAFDVQRTDQPFADAWDVRMDSLATETGLHRFNIKGLS